MGYDDIIWGVVLTLLSFGMGYILFLMFNKVPAKWFCDYDEEPGEELLSQRVFFKRGGIVFSILLAITFILCRYQYDTKWVYNICFCLAISVLFIISVADFKYCIIPDQFTAALAVIFAVISIYDIISKNNILHTVWYQPLIGGICGGAIMLLINLLSRLIYKKDGIGFGDVKLFAAVGIVAGIKGIFICTFLSLITATICFIVIMLFNSIKKDSYLAFGPYIAISTILYIIFKCNIEQILQWYLKIISA